jgi:hypothetical protein
VQSTVGAKASEAAEHRRASGTFFA